MFYLAIEDNPHTSAPIRKATGAYSVPRATSQRTYTIKGVISCWVVRGVGSEVNGAVYVSTVVVV